MIIYLFIYLFFLSTCFGQQNIKFVLFEPLGIWHS